MASNPQHPESPPHHLLWAPWRIEYIRGIQQDNCFICEKLGADPAEDENNLVLARGKTCALLLNAYPYNSGHVLVAPHRHVADIADLTDAEMSETMQLVQAMKRIQDRLMHPDGYNFGFNLGAAAGAGLRTHIHGHLVPRWTGDTNFMPVIGDTRVVPQALSDTGRMLREGWEKDRRMWDAGGRDRCD